MIAIVVAMLALLAVCVLQQLQIAALRRKMTKLDPWTLSMVSVCSCGHGWGMHDESGRCKKQVGMYKSDVCECRRCDAPPPIHLTT